MPTMKQKKALENLVANGGNAAQAMKDAGYSEATAHTPSKLRDSKGFIQLMDELGLTDDLIVNALVDDIKAKPGMRTQELALAVKMRGRMIEKVDHTTNGKDLPTPILGGISVHSDSIDTQDTEPKEED